MADDVALACGTTHCLATWQRAAGLYGVKIDKNGKASAPELLVPTLPGVITTESDYVAAEGNTVYALYESQLGNAVHTRLVIVNTTTSVKSLPTTTLTYGGTLSETRLTWGHGIGMLAQRYFDSSYGSSPLVLFLSASGTWLGSSESFSSTPFFYYGPFAAAISDGFVMRWDADDKMYPADCGWAKFDETGSGGLRPPECPGSPVNSTVYAMKSYGNTVYSLSTFSTLLSLSGKSFDGTPSIGIGSVDKQARTLAVNATHVWTFTSAGKVDRYELASETKTGTLTLPTPGSQLGGMAVALLPDRVVVARVPYDNSSFSAVVDSWPVAEMSETAIVTEVIP